ncbi:MAG TPA: type VI secretion system baseplate subunit TssG, partial [Telluria sp.]
CCRLRSGAAAPALGSSTVLGTRVWNCQHKFRVVIGPVELDDYRRMLPGGDSFARLRDWVRNYAGMAYDWDINLQLKRAAVPPTALGQARVGWTSWLHSRMPRQDARQVIFHPRQGATRSA